MTTVQWILILVNAFAGAGNLIVAYGPPPRLGYFTLGTLNLIAVAVGVTLWS